MKWNSDECGREFYFFTDALTAYVWRDKLTWYWHIKYDKLTYYGNTQFTANVFEQVEEIIKQLQQD